jgi:hypothetical protein
LLGGIIKILLLLFLGVGKIVSFKDVVAVKDGQGRDTTSIELKLTIEDSDFIIPDIIKTPATNIKETNTPLKSSFALEKHLESSLLATGIILF